MIKFTILVLKEVAYEFTIVAEDAAKAKVKGHELVNNNEVEPLHDEILDLDVYPF